MKLNDLQNTINNLKQAEKESILNTKSIRNSITFFENKLPFDSNLTNISKKESAFLIKLEKASVSDKFLLILEQHQRFMRTKEIAQYLALKLDNDAKYWTGKLSQKTAGLKIIDKITKIQVGNAKFNSYWGFPSWLDKNGQIIEEYKYEK